MHTWDGGCERLESAAFARGATSASKLEETRMTFTAAFNGRPPMRPDRSDRSLPREAC